MSLWTNFKFFTDALSYCSPGRHMIPKCNSRQNEIPVMNTKKSGIYWERRPLQYYSRNMKKTFCPFHSLRPPRKNVRLTAQHSLRKAKEKRRSCGCFPWVAHAHNVHNVTEFSFIHLGETFPLAVSPDIYNTVIKE